MRICTGSGCPSLGIGQEDNTVSPPDKLPNSAQLIDCSRTTGVILTLTTAIFPLAVAEQPIQEIQVPLIRQHQRLIFLRSHAGPCSFHSGNTLRINK
jgi:hypothetical protein